MKLLYLGDIVGRAAREKTCAELPRLRDPAAAEFNALKRELGQLVMEEQQRHHHDELRMAAVD